MQLLVLYSSFGMEAKYESVRLETDEAIKAAQNFFGTTVLLGIWHRRPKKGNCYLLHTADEKSIGTSITDAVMDSLWS